MNLRSFLRPRLNWGAVLGVVLLVLVGGAGLQLWRTRPEPATAVIVGMTVLFVGWLAVRLLRHSIWDDSVT